jgi:glycosyltransferase involved in cell wall biosynthesis
MKPRIVIAINTAWNLVNFRMGLMRALSDAGYEVVAVSPFDAYASQLGSHGIRHVVMPMDNRGTNPFRDFGLFLRMLLLLRREKPVAYLGYTIKPNIYGSLAAQLLGIPVINNISGLGATFIKESFVTRLVKLLYRLALRKSSKVFFQNEDDRRLFVDAGLVPEKITGLLPGSGISLHHFQPAPLPLARKTFRFLLVARLLWDKGVGEYIDAARNIRAGYPHAEFCLLGFVDVENPQAISRATVEAWAEEDGIHYLGVASDVRPHIADAHCVVLPSYREGTPRSLLEAAAMGRPLIATDAPGCREVVDHGINGYLCEVRNAHDLADKMMTLMRHSDEILHAMGQASRSMVERQFDEGIVIGKYLDAIREISNEAAADVKRR